MRGITPDGNTNAADDSPKEGRDGIVGCHDGRGWQRALDPIDGVT